MRPTPDPSIEVRRIPGFEKYEASACGCIRRVGSAQWLSQHRSKQGEYWSVGLWIDGRTRVATVHRLVALAFHGLPPEGKNDCAHTDGNKDNNSAGNLRWASRAENEADKVRHGRSNRGERNGQSRLTDEAAARIRAEAIAGGRGTQRRLARQYGVSDGAICNIVKGKRWVHGHA